MTLRRARLQGADQHRRLGEVLGRLLSEWHRQWSVTPNAATLQPAAPIERAPSEFERLRGDFDGRRIEVWLESRFDAVLGAALSGTRSVDSVGLAARMGQRALRSLLTLWLGAPSEAEVSFDAAAGQASAGPYPLHTFGLELPGTRANVLVDWAAVDALAPLPVAPEPPLASRLSCLGPERLMLQVRLELGEGALDQTCGLHPGDVLSLAAPLDRPFELSTATGERLFQGRLVRQGAQLAFHVQSLASLRNLP